MASGGLVLLREGYGGKRVWSALGRSNGGTWIHEKGNSVKAGDEMLLSGDPSGEENG